MAVVFPDEIHPKYRLRMRFEHFARANQYLSHFKIVALYPSYEFIPLDLKFNSIDDLNQFLLNRGIVYHEFDVSDTYPYIKKEFTIVDARKIYDVEESVSKYLLNYKFYSINEVGEMLSCSRPTVYKMVHDHTLKAIRIHGQIRINHLDLMAYIKSEK
jgi:excisionase family DNA binding protein